MVWIYCFRIFMEGSFAGEHITPPEHACPPSGTSSLGSRSSLSLPINRRSEHQLLRHKHAPIPPSRDSRGAEEMGGRDCYLCLDLRLGQILIFTESMKLVIYYRNKISSLLFRKGGVFCCCLFLTFLPCHSGPEGAGSPRWGPGPQRVPPPESRLQTLLGVFMRID